MGLGGGQSQGGVKQLGCELLHYGGHPLGSHVVQVPGQESSANVLNSFVTKYWPNVQLNTESSHSKELKSFSLLYFFKALMYLFLRSLEVAFIDPIATLGKNSPHNSTIVHVPATDKRTDVWS